MMKIGGRPIALMITSMLIATVFAGCSGLGNINPNDKIKLIGVEDEVV